jgi:replication factor C small subunit
MHDHIQRKFQNFYDKREIPHIILYGNAGCGKKTLLHQFIQLIYQQNHRLMKSNILTVDCSQEGKSIKFIREDLKLFAKTNIGNEKGDIQFKSIILYNADFLSIDAQSALRRCIELYSHNTRFFIVVENVNKLLTPILSRFCLLHVPDIRDHPYNLHQMHIRNQVDLTTEVDRKVVAICNKLRQPAPSHIDLIGITNELYDDGISCLDFIVFLERTVPNSIEIVFNYHRIRSEYRNEKMLLFTLLCMYYRGAN